MAPVTIPTLPREAPTHAIYLFSEGVRHLYAGRTKNLRQRMRNHSIPASQHNQAVFAFRLVREDTGNLVASYSGDGRRVALAENHEFATSFIAAKKRVRAMDLRYVEEADPLRQALLEIYVSIPLRTLYNDFNTH